MRVIGLLSFYDESAAWLGGSVASCAGVVDHLIAVDGAYAAYPGGKPHSGSEQGEVIRETCRALNIGCTIVEPQRTWFGNEVEKRSFLFKQAETVAEEGDWYFVIDADEFVTDWGVGGPQRFRERLAECEYDVGNVTFWNRRIPHPRDLDEDNKWIAAVPQIEENTVRIIFRAIPGLRVVERHYWYQLPDGRYLWGDGRQEPAADFTDIRIEHRTEYRDPARRKAAQEYYTRRAVDGLEGGR